MNYLIRILIFFALSFSCNTNADDKDIVVVIHVNNPITIMTKSQVIDLFMGKYEVFPDNNKAQPLDIIGNTALKEEFYSSLVGMSLARVNSYWSRIKFTGRIRPLVKQETEDDIVAYLNNSENAIAYVTKEKLNSNMKVVYQFHE